jgi:hypothetical protein|tara:strand:+ start:688 stop:1056 length:369 start_codon:yes stop_codon:yes gene_type:complete
MATRKFNGIEYPIPGVDTAIQTLYPGARYDLNNTTFDAWEDDEGRQPPDWKDVEAEIIREVKIYNYYLYERNRQQQYPEIKDQLDMLYHDLKSGNLNNGTWIAAIDAVKENNPKPEGPEPKL